tara:strand:+ start:1770 stop:3080 length:1311 start_codon:yes stop_codon:yes gene_type:complete
MLGKKNFMTSIPNRRVEPAFSGTVTMVTAPTYIAVANNDIQISISSNYNVGTKLLARVSGINTDIAPGAYASVDSNGDATISCKIKLSTWGDHDATPINVRVITELGTEIANVTGNIYSTYSNVLPTTNFTIGSGESRKEGINITSGSTNIGNLTYNAEIDYMIIGGGGAGGDYGGNGGGYGGAGGAGGFKEQLHHDLVPIDLTGNIISTQGYFASVGAGGIANTVGTGGDTRFYATNDVAVSDPSYPSFQANVAVMFGGGNGGFRTQIDGSDGASGGGAFGREAGRFTPGIFGGLGGSGTAGQGFDGADYRNTNSGGGGGASGDAPNPYYTADVPPIAINGYGGKGFFSTITGANVGYAGGGFARSPSSANPNDYGAGKIATSQADRDATNGSGSGGGGGFTQTWPNPVGTGGSGGDGSAVFVKYGDYTTNVILD